MSASTSNTSSFALPLTPFLTKKMEPEITRGKVDSLGGPLRFSFLAPTLPVLRARGQPPPPITHRPLVGKCTYICCSLRRLGSHPGPAPTSLGPENPSLAPFLGAHTTSLPSSGNPLPGAPHTAVLAPLCSALLPTWERPGISPKTQPSLGPSSAEKSAEKNITFVPTFGRKGNIHTQE